MVISSRCESSVIVQHQLSDDSTVQKLENVILLHLKQTKLMKKDRTHSSTEGYLCVGAKCIVRLQSCAGLQSGSS